MFTDFFIPNNYLDFCLPVGINFWLISSRKNYNKCWYLRFLTLSRVLKPNTDTNLRFIQNHAPN